MERRCLSCGYVIDGLPEDRCPECGRHFDLEDPTTSAVDDQPKPGFGRDVVLLAMSIAGWPILLRLDQNNPWFSLLGVGIEGVVLSVGTILLVTRRCRHRLIILLSLGIALWALSALTIPRLY